VICGTALAKVQSEEQIWEMAVSTEKEESVCLKAADPKDFTRHFFSFEMTLWGFFGIVCKDGWG
jgi:hypothetical protein